MGGKFLTDNQMLRRFLVGMFIANFLAQAIGWGYRYWSGHEYSAERRQAEHWEQVYSVVMAKANCFTDAVPQATLIDNKPIGKLTVLSCDGHSNLSMGERKDRLQQFNPNFKLVDKPSKLPGMHIVTVDTDKIAVLLPENSPAINTSIAHLIDAPAK